MGDPMIRLKPSESRRNYILVSDGRGVVRAKVPKVKVIYVSCKGVGVVTVRARGFFLELEGPFRVEKVEKMEIRDNMVLYFKDEVDIFTTQL